jgi:hypothetical protein
MTYDIHSVYLHEWMKPKHYKKVGLSLDDIVSVIPEPVWYPNQHEQHTLCDYIIILQNQVAIPSELKGSRCQRHKARNQLKAGKEYINEVLGMYCQAGLFLVYENGIYHHEWMEDIKG